MRGVQKEKTKILRDALLKGWIENIIYIGS
jgi:hypothetical protein